MKSGYIVLGDEETSDNKSSLHITVTNPDIEPEPPPSATTCHTSIIKTAEPAEEKQRASQSRPQEPPLNYALGEPLLNTFDVDVVNSVELLVHKQEEKKRSEIKGKYFGRCLIVFPMPLQSIWDNTLEAIWEHNVQKIITLSDESGNIADSQIWSKIGR